MNRRGLLVGLAAFAHRESTLVTERTERTNDPTRASWYLPGARNLKGKRYPSDQKKRGKRG